MFGTNWIVYSINCSLSAYDMLIISDSVYETDRYVLENTRQPFVIGLIEVNFNGWTQKRPHNYFEL